MKLLKKLALTSLCALCALAVRADEMDIGDIVEDAPTASVAEAVTNDAPAELSASVPSAELAADLDAELADLDPAPTAPAESEIRPEGEIDADVPEIAENDDADPSSARSASGLGVDEIDVEEYDDARDAAKLPQIRVETESGAINPENEGDLITISCDNNSLDDVIRQYRRATKANIITPDATNFNQKVSVSLTKVPWLDSLTAILQVHKLRINQKGGIYYISPESKEAKPTFTRPFTLDHADAKEVAKLINNVNKAQIANPYPDANVVVITATEDVLTACHSIIASIDKAVSQIYIEARFVELSADASHKLGMNWSIFNNWGISLNNMKVGHLSTHSKLNGWNYTMNDSVVGYSESDSSVEGYSRASERKQSTTKGTLLPDNYTSVPLAGATEDDMTWRRARAYSGQLSIDDFRIALSAFEKLEDARLFSNPKIIVSNGKEALVDMTTKRPNVVRRLTYHEGPSGGEIPEYTSEIQAIPGEDKMLFAKEAFFSYGITLKVIPRISPNGLINVEVEPTISNLEGEIGGGDDGNTFPVIRINRLSTNFTMQDGATAVIGGLSQTEERDIDSGIPVLRKIPWIGPWLFGWKSRVKIQKEIIVFVTVGIANPQDLPTDIGLPKNAVLGREYTNGGRLEPGDREGGAKAMKELDLRPLEVQREEEEAKATIRRIKRQGGK